MSNGPDLYGGFDLRRGDRDAGGGAAARWGGVEQGAGETARHVEALQRDLDQLGFHLVGGADGVFGRRTGWAVREFQLYARCEQVAREDVDSTAARYLERLSPVATGAARYAGPISGVADAATRSALARWLAEDWRCPLVIEAWSRRHGRRHVLRAGNLWLHDELASATPRMYARDFSAAYDEPPPELLDDGLVTLGEFVPFLRWSGPRSQPPHHVWPAAEILPENLIGLAEERLDAAQRSTFNVVRAVSEVECLGFFDSLNAYDNAFVSAGPCHWTLGKARASFQLDRSGMPPPP